MHTPRPRKSWALLPQPAMPANLPDLAAVALSFDGSTILLAGSQGTAFVLRPASNAVHWLVGHRATVSAVALSDDGRTAVTGAYDATVRVWTIAGDLDCKDAAMVTIKFLVLRGHTGLSILVVVTLLLLSGLSVELVVATRPRRCFSSNCGNITVVSGVSLVLRLPNRLTL